MRLPAFEAANSRYGSAPPGSAANQRWVVGLALDSTRNGSPTIAARTHDQPERGRRAVGGRANGGTASGAATSTTSRRDDDQPDLEPGVTPQPERREASGAPSA